MSCEFEKESLSVASIIIREEKKEKKYMITLLVIALVCTNFFCAAVAWKALDFVSGYTYESEVTVESSGDSSAIYQNGEGNNINVGKGESEENNETKGY